MKEERTPILTASIVTFNTDVDELTKCISALREDGIDKLWIVDNSPGNELEDSIGRLCTCMEIEYIPSHDNPGYGAAHNKAIQRAIEYGATYHLVINSDVYFQKGTIPAIARYMDANPQIGQLQPRIVYPDGREQYSSRLLPSPFDSIGRKFLPKRLMEKRNRRYLLSNRPEGMALDIPYHQGSFMFFRISALQEIGLFDERFFMYPEDIDITRRMHRKYKTIYWPEVSVVHAHRASSYHDSRMSRIHMRNMIRYFNKWGWIFDLERIRFNRRVLREIKASLKS